MPSQAMALIRVRGDVPRYREFVRVLILLRRTCAAPQSLLLVVIAAAAGRSLRPERSGVQRIGANPRRST
jgi:hypothetical protein